MNHKNILAVLFLALSITACTQEESVVPTDTDNVLSQLPGNTPVRIITLLDGKETESRAGTDETFAANEIHEQGKLKASLYIMKDEIARVGNDGGLVEADFTAGEGEEGVTFDGISAMKNATDKKLTLNAFPNRNEWTILWGEYYTEVSSLADSICGWSQLAIHAETNEPVLVYNMQRTRAKVTLKLTDADTNEDMCLCEEVSATIYTEETLSSVVREEDGFALAIFNNPLKVTPLSERYLGLPYNVEGVKLDLEESHAVEEKLTELTGLARASATHKYTLTDNSTMVKGGTIERLTETEMAKKTEGYLSVTIGDDYPHFETEKNEVGGTYQISLKDIDMGDGGKLTRLEAGHHYIITLSLSHNKLVSATAAIGEWDTYTGKGTISGDESKVSENN